MDIIVSFMDSTTKTGLRVMCDTSGVVFPAIGRLYTLYTYGGVETIEFVPDTTGYCVDIGGLVKPIFGCVVIRHLSDTLHSQHFSVVAGGHYMAYYEVPVNRADAIGPPKVTVLKSGVEVTVTTDDLKKVGIITVTSNPIDVDIPAVPDKFLSLFQ
jgi:hypothetical protein